MSDSKQCPNCGEAVKEDSQFCPSCGTDLSTGKAYDGAPDGTEKRALDHITVGYTVAFDQPIVFLPPLISGLLGTIVSYIGAFSGTLSLILGVMVSILSFILTFASLDMSRDAYYKQPLDLMRSVNYIAGRFFIFLIAAIFGGILSITIILIPVVLFMFVIMVMDETDIMDSFQKSIEVIRAELSDVIVIIIVSIIASAIVSFIPLVSSILDVIVNVIFGISFIDIYATYKSK